MPSSSSSSSRLSVEEREREERKKERKRKTQSIGSIYIYIDLKSLPDMSAKGQVKGKRANEREKQIHANEQ